MPGNRKGGRGRLGPTASDVGAGEGVSTVDPVAEGGPPTVPITPPSEHDLARLRLRQRWELASVLHFLHVFQPIIGSDLEITAEEIETALITPNDVLAEVHIGLLKGIPPVSKNMASSDAWVTVLCKKIATWWHWVAEGDVPIIVDHGEEITRYKELDPTSRLLILKALCEIRAEQYDIPKYIDDELKCGTELSAFRKDRIGGDGYGTAFWYDGDSVLGHRLYREMSNVKFKHGLKGRGSLTQPEIIFQWETLATNLEEFREISDKLSASTVVFESAVGEVIKNDIMPNLEKLQKKKERALKRQQRKTMQPHDFIIPLDLGQKRTCRDRRPISYTFDEFDRSIEEAIQMDIEVKMNEESNDEGEQKKDAADGMDMVSGGKLYEVDNSGKSRGDDDDEHDDDYDEKDDAEEEDDNDTEDDSESGSSDKENNDDGQRMPFRNAQKQKDLQPRVVVGLRRSLRTAASSRNEKTDVSDVDTRIHADTEKRLRQRPNDDRNHDDTVIVPDSEDGSSSSEEADSGIP